LYRLVTLLTLLIPSTLNIQEGKTATELDPAIDLRYKHGKHLSESGRFLEAADILSQILSASCSRYGQLATVCAPIYYEYGHALLKIVESSSDALGGKTQEAAREEEEEEKAAAAAEEDIGEEDEAEDANDLQVAYECLDVARVLYTRAAGAAANPKEISEIRLLAAKAQKRIGDCHMEQTAMKEAIGEYQSTLATRAELLPDHDERIFNTLYALYDAYFQLANHVEKGEAQFSDNSEKERRDNLTQAQTYALAACESVCKDALLVAKAHGFEAFSRAFIAEINAGALQKIYPSGVSTTAIAGSSSTTTSVSGTSSEPDVRVFTTIASKLESTSSNEKIVDELKMKCDYIDFLLQKRTEISADLNEKTSLSMAEILKKVAEATGADIAGFSGAGESSDSITFGSISTTSSSVLAATIAPKRKLPDASSVSSAQTVALTETPLVNRVIADVTESTQLGGEEQVEPSSKRQRVGNDE
jgi:hypothetical protein